MDYFLSTALTFFFVLDALGRIPSYLSVLEQVKPDARQAIATREIFLSLVALFVYFYAGHFIVTILGIDPATVEVSGGVVLFIIAIRLIYEKADKSSPKWYPGIHPFVPIATPLIASPSVFAALMIFSVESAPRSTILLAIVVAWLVSAIIYFFAKPIHRFMKEQGLLAIERLMGLLVALIAIQRILNGLSVLIRG